MCGSFGFELNPTELSGEERDAIPGILADHTEINPMVISGSFYRLVLPDESNWPAVQIIAEDESKSVVFAFQQKATVKPAAPPLRLQGLDPTARYMVNAESLNGTLSGATLMNAGINLYFEGDYDSQLVWLYKQ